MIVLFAVLGVLALVAVFDLVQRRHAITRNFPVVGHLRFMLEAIGPELRQYIVTDNDSERPFSRDERRWVYTTAKGGDSTFGFGTDNRFESIPSYIVVKHSAFPTSPPPLSESGVRPIPGAKVLGAAHGRAKAVRPPSVVNVSAMSFGSLSGAAITALNLGAAKAGCWHNTGEGGISKYHLQGADLIWQIGTGYFGCRTPDGRFDLSRLVDEVADKPVRAIEIKISQGAKPGLGGLLPAAKVTREIAEIRGIPEGQTCHSPPAHSAFTDVPTLVEFVELVAGATGLPVGIKSAVGQQDFWFDLAAEMGRTGGGPDFVTIDGGEGGTGAAPLVFADHVALPFFWGFGRVYRAFAEADLADDVVFVGSGRLGLPDRAAVAFGLGCDLVHVAREAMLSIGCIQAQRCHSGRCPTGVATQSPWLARGLDPTLKSERAARYLVGLREEMLRLANACGLAHPALLSLDHIDLLDGDYVATSARAAFGYEAGWGVPGPAVRRELEAAWPAPPVR